MNIDLGGKRANFPLISSQFKGRFTHRANRRG